MNTLHNRIIEISKKYKLSHVGSCLTAVDIIDEIYATKRPNDKFVLSCGHAGLALYVVLEKWLPVDAEELFLTHGVHPNRDNVIDCSTGSLGQGLPIALGMAMAKRSKNVYCLISDGEAAEGTIWEVANTVAKYNVKNLKIYCNWNWWGAYDKTSSLTLKWLESMFADIHVRVTNVEDYNLTGQSAHYVTLK